MIMKGQYSVFCFFHLFFTWRSYSPHKNREKWKIFKGKLNELSVYKLEQKVLCSLELKKRKSFENRTAVLTLKLLRTYRVLYYWFAGIEISPDLVHVIIVFFSEIILFDNWWKKIVTEILKGIGTKNLHWWNALDPDCNYTNLFLNLWASITPRWFSLV